MKKLAFAALFVGLLAACGGGDDGIGIVPDSGVDPIDGGDACNAVSNTGCATGEKCTWINIDSANDIGTLGCVADGTAALGDACTYGPDGETTGYDNCQGTNICIYSVCEAICTTSPDSCGNTSSCSSYAGVFPDMSGIGACDFLCDPVTQIRTFDSEAACGTTTGTGGIARGCYGGFDREFSCTGVPGPAANLVHGSTAYGPASGGAYVNGCAPGYSPLLRAANDATAPVICMAYCQPVETYLGNTTGADGAAGFTCNNRGAISGTPPMECHFLWIFDDAPVVERNGYGYCWQPNNYVGDWDGDTTTADSAWPNCTTLANTDANSDGLGTDGAVDNYFWGCAPFVAAANGLPQKRAKSPFKALNREEAREHFAH